MDIVLALLRTLIFVVATVAITVYVGRRLGRGHSLLWTGTTLLVLYWLIGFGWTTYRAGAPDTTPDVAGWVSWLSYLLPFFAALAYVWGIGQAAGVPARGSARTGSGAAAAATPAASQPAAGQPGSVQPTGHGFPPGTAQAAASGSAGSPAPGRSGPVVSPQVSPFARTAPPAAHTPAEPRPRHKTSRPPGLIVPHAVPVVMTPSASHHSPLDPDPVADLGPDEDAAPGTPVPPPGTPPIVPAGWAPAGPRPTSSSAAPGQPSPGGSEDQRAGERPSP